MLLGAGAGALIPLLLLGGLILYNDKGYEAEKEALKSEHRLELEQIKQADQAALIQGWAPKSPVSAGQIIEEDNLTGVAFPKASAPGDLLAAKASIVGKAAKIDLAKGTLITSSLLFGEEPTTRDLRYREMSFIRLPASLKKGEVIDIRVQFPTGEDYILLAKKKVLNLADSTLSVTLGENEILTLSSAIVDAYLNKASIYALTYVEPGLQDKAIPTYPANKQVAKLIARDPNIVAEAESHLNQSSREMLDQGLAALSPQNALNYAGGQAASTANSAPASREELLLGSEKTGE